MTVKVPSIFSWNLLNRIWSAWAEALCGIESEVVSREFKEKLEKIPKIAMINQISKTANLCFSTNLVQVSSTR